MMAKIQRTKIKIEDLKTIIIELVGEGLTRHDIQKRFEKEYKVPSRTFDRYWKTAISLESEKIKEKKNELFVGYFNRNVNRIREASIQYNATKDRNWLHSSHTFEKDFMDRMQSMGLAEKEPERVEITKTDDIKETLDEIMDETRRLYSLEKKGITGVKNTRGNKKVVPKTVQK